MQIKERMKKVEIKDKETDEKHAVGNKFILASHTYNMSLHGRLLANGNEDGVSCNDCHTPGKEKHGIMNHKDIESSTHQENLSKTCSASGCHQFANKYANSGFTNTDMHDLDYVPVYDRLISNDALNLNTGWKLFLAFLTPVIIILIIGSLLWTLLAKKSKSVTFSLFGGNHFQKHMIGRKPKSKTKKSKLKKEKTKIQRKHDQ